MWRLGALLLSIALLAPGAASAQVNTEKLRSWEKSGLGGNLDFALTLRAGNVRQTELGASTRVQWARLHAATSSTARGRLRDLVYFVGDLGFGLQTGERLKNEGFAHVRWTHMWSPLFGTEVYVQAQYNEFLRLQQRYLGGIGGRLEVIAGKNGEVVIGSGYMLEFEQNDVPVDGPDERRVLAHRWTSYVALKAYLLEPKVSVVETVYVQPRLTDFGDYRLLSEGELIVSVTETLALVASLSLRYDSQPVAGIDELDLTMENKLRVSF